MIIVLLPGFSWSEIWASVFHEFLIAAIAALIIVTIHYMWHKFTDMIAWFLPVRVYGKWSTFLTKPSPPLIENEQSVANQMVYENVWERTANGKKYRYREQMIDLKRDALAQNGGNSLSEERRHEDAELHQFLHWVWGHAKLKTNPNVQYVVAGYVRGEKLSLVYREKKGNDTGAILLDIKSKTLMEGFEVGCEKDKGSIYSNLYRWRRQ